MQRFYSIWVWTIAITSNNISHPSAGFDVLHYVQSWEFPDHACFLSVRFVFVPAIIFILPVTASVGSVIALRVVLVKCHSVCGDAVVDFTLIHIDSVQHCQGYFQRTEKLGSTFVSCSFAVGHLSTDRCCRGNNCAWFEPSVQFSLVACIGCHEFGVHWHW